MTTRTFTPAEFAAEFPRARNHDAAIRYVAVTHHPRQIVRASDIACAMDEVAVAVGHTNKSGTKTISRFAIVAGNVAGAM